MNFDEADLAILEVYLHKIEDEVARGLVQVLVDDVRELQERAEEVERLLAEARKKAKDGREALRRMRGHLENVDNVPEAVWQHEDEADDLFVEIEESDG